MIYFDLESHLGTLYKIEAITWENGKPKDKFFAVTNADMPDAVRRITGITHEQSLTGTDEREAVFAFWNFLQRNQAVAAQKIVVNGKEYHKISCIGYGVSRELQKIFLRFGIRIVFNNEERGDLYEYANTYCNHLPLKSFRQTVVNRYCSIQETELNSLPLLHTALVREAKRPITEEECEQLVSRLTNFRQRTKIYCAPANGSLLICSVSSRYAKRNLPIRYRVCLRKRKCSHVPKMIGAGSLQISKQELRDPTALK